MYNYIIHGLFLSFSSLFVFVDNEILQQNCVCRIWPSYDLTLASLPPSLFLPFLSPSLFTLKWNVTSHSVRWFAYGIKKERKKERKKRKEKISALIFADFRAVFRFFRNLRNVFRIFFIVKYAEINDLLNFRKIRKIFYPERVI